VSPITRTADRALGERGLDRAAGCRPRDERDASAGRHTGEVILASALRRSADHHDRRLGGPVPGTPANALGEVDAVRPRLRVGTGARERRRRGEVHERHRETLEVRATVAERLEADRLELVRDVLRRVAIAGRSAVPAATRRVGEVGDVFPRPRAVEDAGPRDSCGRRRRGRGGYAWRGRRASGRGSA